MAFPSITDFKEKLVDGGARPSLFEMQLTFPVALSALAGPQTTAAQDMVRFHCKIAEIPGTAQNPIIIKYAGREIKYSGQRIFNNLIITIINDEGFKVRRGIEAWMESMNTRESNISLLTAATGIAGYGGTGIVNQYTKRGEVTRSYKFIDLFPVTLAPIPLDWQNDAVVEEYTCEFAYQYWIPSGEDAALDPQGRFPAIAGAAIPR